jgi:hypothetical protein
MNPQVIRDLVHRQPFEPFEIRLSNGEVHAVKHPEFIIITANRLIVVDPDTDRMSLLSIIHVAEVRMLQAASN